MALGLVTADSFGGLRALLVPSSERRPSRRRRSVAAFDVQDAGRWSLVRRNAAANSDAVEHVARTLLRRYGVVFWRLIDREAAWLPPWRELLRVYRRLESRGEIRGGRFVAGFTGEQFALPEAIGALRETRRQGDTDILVAVSGSDPLNLAGILTPGPRIAALTGNRVLYRDGVPVAALTAGEVSFFGKPTRPPNGRHVRCCCAARCGLPRLRRSRAISALSPGFICNGRTCRLRALGRRPQFTLPSREPHAFSVDDRQASGDEVTAARI